MTGHPYPLCLRTGEHHPGCPTVTAPPPEQWAVLEKMGHKILAGRVSEVEVFGGKCGRIDCPLPDGTFVTHLFHAQVVYGLTYCSEAAARAKAAKCDPAPVGLYDLPPEVRDAYYAAAEARRAKAAKALPAADPDFDPGTVRRDRPSKPMYHGERPEGVYDEDDTDEDSPRF